MYNFCKVDSEEQKLCIRILHERDQDTLIEQSHGLNQQYIIKEEQLEIKIL